MGQEGGREGYELCRGKGREGGKAYLEATALDLLHTLILHLLPGPFVVLRRRRVDGCEMGLMIMGREGRQGVDDGEEGRQGGDDGEGGKTGG